MRIYLAGGMHTTWQDIFIEGYPLITFFDPRKSGLTDAPDYTKWDLNAIDQSHIVIAYMESSNPSGIGTVLEIGYALGQGKLVYFANEKEDRYFHMVNCASTFFFNTFADLLFLFDEHYMNRRFPVHFNLKSIDELET